MDKKIYLTLMILVLLSCDQSKSSSKIKSEPLNGTDTIRNEINVKKEQILEKVTEPNEQIISDTVKFSSEKQSDFAQLIDIVRKHNPKLKTVLPVTYGNGKWHGIFQQGDSIKFIPFFIDPDWEQQMFTKWKIISDTTIKYDRRIKPNLYSKYSFAFILDIVNIKGQEYFIGETAGGEGGEIWQSIWTAKYNGIDEINKVDHYETGYEDEELSSTLDYELKNNIFSIVLNVDSIIYSSDTIISFPISSQVVKTVELK